jgi:repressor of nif and glnA expression
MGRILANFCGIPAPSRARINEKIGKMNGVDIGGAYRLGNTSESICMIPMWFNRAGMVSFGGRNVMAVASKADIEV